MLKKPLLWDKIQFRLSPLVKMKLQSYIITFSLLMFLIVYHITSFQYKQAQVEKRLYPFDSVTSGKLRKLFHDSISVNVICGDPNLIILFSQEKELDLPAIKLDYLPHGIVQASSDMEMKPLWSTRSSTVKDDIDSNTNLLAIPAGIKQRRSVDAIVTKFLSESFTVILFHYDGNVNDWQDLQWCNKAIHVAAHNQTKWWFAKRFLHPDVVSIYDYIFLWDEDLGLENFHPRRYLSIVKAEGLEISQPALDPKQSEVHHKITIRKRRYIVHRKVRDNVKCLDDREAPPCSGWVEGMAPVFSRSAWRCTWHLIQNDLIHGWGMDMKLGYCAQGDRRKKVGVVDSEFIVHRGIQTLGGSFTLTAKKAFKDANIRRSKQAQSASDERMESRRQAKLELQIFQDRWHRAAMEDTGWVDPFWKRKHARLTSNPPRSQ